MSSKKSLVISGIGPGPTGVGRYMEALTSRLFHTHDFYYVEVNQSIRKLKNSKRYWSICLELWKRISTRVVFTYRIFKTRNRKVFLIHPQSIGLFWYSYLMKHNEITHVIVDNFWFCKKSYNVRNNKNCLLCLSQMAPEASECSPINPTMRSKSYRNFYHDFRNSAGKYFVQTESQKKLLIRGNVTTTKNIRVVGLKLDEINFDHERGLSHLSSEGSVSSIFFHGALIEAKGYNWLLQLSKLLPHVTFVIPSKHMDKSFSLPNIRVVEASWGSDFVTLMQSCDMVLCPSIWSYVIEGSLIKSLWFHGIVGVVDVPNSFCDTLPEGVALKLSSDPRTAANQLIHFKLSDINQDAVSDFVIGLDAFSAEKLANFD